MLSSFPGIYPSDASRTPPHRLVPIKPWRLSPDLASVRWAAGRRTAPRRGPRLCSDQGAPSSQKWVQTPD